jgi:hypothetical protein
VIQRLELGPRGALVAHFIISVYGGYFGGGIGFLLLAALTLFGMRDINAMNGLKMWLVGIMTVASRPPSSSRMSSAGGPADASRLHDRRLCRRACRAAARPTTVQGLHRRARRRGDDLFLLARSLAQDGLRVAKPIIGECNSAGGYWATSSCCGMLDVCNERTSGGAPVQPLLTQRCQEPEPNMCPPIQGHTRRAKLLHRGFKSKDSHEWLPSNSSRT